MTQFPLDLGHSAALTREDFLVSDCNADAAGWIDRWPAWTAPALVLHGAQASGKTHLLKIWADKSGAAVFDGASLAGENLRDRLGDAVTAAVDDIDGLAGNRGGEEALFHLYNVLRERNGYLLVTARKPAARLEWRLADLRSRLLAAESVGIGLPDDALLTALLVKLFADRQLRVSEDVVRYAVPRVQRSFAAVKALVEALDRQALADKRPVTVATVRAALAENGL